jgi:hypothetical protein
MHPPEASPANYLNVEAAWRRQIEESLRGEESWLALTGLFWLREGGQAAGADDRLPIVLPNGAAPLLAGTFHLDHGVVTFSASEEAPARVNGEPATSARLEPDTSPTPSRLEIGRLRMLVIRRGERLGLRVWDPGNPRRSSHPPRRWYPVDPAWRLLADVVAYDPPRPVRVVNCLGDMEEETLPGEVIVDHAGHVARLQVYSWDEGGLFLAFRDRTSGESTYPAGRYLRTAAPADGRVILDFNRATNPPCAFTSFATCSLPPRANVLPYGVTAGEQYAGLEDHGAGG